MSRDITATFLRSGGRLAHVVDPDGKRVVTIAYFRLPPSSGVIGTLRYGASVFCYDDDTPVFDKYERRANNKQAIERYLRSPITVDDCVTQYSTEVLRSGTIEYARRTYLRDQIRRHGAYDHLAEEPVTEVA